MNLIKSFVFQSIMVIMVFGGWSGCYTQLATSSDNPEPVIYSRSDIIDQPPPVTIVIVNPMGDPAPESYYPHRWNPTPLAGSASPVTGTDSPPDSPHRQSGYQRSPSTDQNNSPQTDTTPSRTSWSPTPALSTPTPDSNSSTRTSGSTRAGR
jgi:hypothetical protein